LSCALQDVAYTHAAAAAALGALCLWRGFEEESKTVADTKRGTVKDTNI
jgi:hypothetical protein